MTRFALALIALSTLAACGLQGALERPPPMWGEARADYEREQAAASAAETEDNDKDDAQPTAPAPR